MKRQTNHSAPNPLDPNFIRAIVHEHVVQRRPQLQTLWQYYRNELTEQHPDGQTGRTQRDGLPHRLRRPTGTAREVVIENDIAWRIHTMVDFMFGKPVTIQSLASDANQAARIERALAAAFEANGGICFFQNMALLGSIFGYVDVLVRPSFFTSSPARAARLETAPSIPSPLDRMINAASNVVLETVEAPRAVPVVDEDDYRKLAAYAVHFTKQLNELQTPSVLQKILPRTSRTMQRKRIDVTELWTPGHVELWHDQQLVSRVSHPWGAVPIVHVQNLPQPLSYAGLSEVEPLIPLQNELNTRLSDRANRVTMQSFKMYLGKGIENFIERPIGPGQMWMTDNQNASIEEFGGDAHSPSEDAHILEIREAIDKVSGVSPLAAGILRNKVGNLTSENALRVTLMGLLAKTERKRITYGLGIEQICARILQSLHRQGVLHTSEADRAVRLHWPSPLPENTAQRLAEAKTKLAIGVPQQQVLAELGYSKLEEPVKRSEPQA